MPEPLSPDEVEALLSLARSATGRPVERYNALPSHQIRIYEFQRPERVSKNQGIALEALHEVFARNLSASLSTYLRHIVEVRLVSVEQCTYSEFTMSLPIPTSFNLLSCEPLEGKMILEVDPSILYPIIDRLLGGGRIEAITLERPFTDIELALVDSVLERMLQQLRETWESVKEIDFQRFATESNPFLRQIVAPNEPIVLLCFEVRMGEYAGSVNLCIPFQVIEPIVPEFSQSDRFAATRSQRGGESRGEILENIADAPLELTAVLAETPVSLVDLLTLRPGDILDTGLSRNAPVTIRIEGRRAFRGAPYLRQGRRVIQILEAIERTDVERTDPDA